MVYIFGMAIATVAFIGLIYLFFKIWDKFGFGALLFIIIPIVLFAIIWFSKSDGLDFLFGLAALIAVLSLGIFLIANEELRERFFVLGIILIIAAILIFLIFYLSTVLVIIKELKTLGVIIIVLIIIAFYAIFGGF